jgi:Ca-activated chloride channel family protein
VTFAHPQLLWLALLPLAFLAWDLLRRRQARTAPGGSKILRAQAGAHSLNLQGPSGESSPLQPRRPRLFLAFGLVFALCALARPQWGTAEEQVFDQSREIIIALDLSRSMLSTDVKPSRLERAKLLVRVLLDRLKGERVGLVVFSGTSFLQCPLSSDYEILRDFLPSLNPDFLPEGGTNYRALLQTSLDAFASTASADRFVIILSDGEALDSDWLPSVDELKTRKIRIIGLGVGTESGSMIDDGKGGFIKDERGAVVLSRLESKTLQQLASATQGAYRDASQWVDIASVLRETVEAGRQGRFLDKRASQAIERYQWALAPAVLLLLASLAFEFPVRVKPRQLIQPPLLAVLLFCLIAPLPCSALQAKPGPAPAPDGSPQTPLGHAVQRLSAKPALSAPDCADLARQTVSWGQGLKASGQQVSDGPIRDGLEAVDAGESLDPKAADWPGLRRQLEALREKQEKQDQEQKDKDQQEKQDQKDRQNQKQDSKQQDKSGDPKQDEQQKQQQEEQKKKDQERQNQQQQQKQDQQQRQQPEKEQPSKPDDMQQVGGRENKPAPERTDPSLALPLQKLEKVKNDDSPGRLFQLMEPDKKPTQPATKKNW